MATKNTKPDESAAKQQLRDLLGEIIDKVPTCVACGSYQTAVNFKKLNSDCRKAMNNDRATLATLMNAHTQLKNMFSDDRVQTPNNHI